ncbi:hypothetical protein MASSI9I_51078 [Massilia sp. 9I]|nr:hypothetical protein MASSI9I_51078 [Massilia sp. 9I]
MTRSSRCSQSKQTRNKTSYLRRAVADKPGAPLYHRRFTEFLSAQSALVHDSPGRGGSHHWVTGCSNCRSIRTHLFWSFT